MFPHCACLCWSGGKATPASLLLNLVTGIPGLLAQRRVVVFDEVARRALGSAESLATLKDIFESGTFSRGCQELQSECSVVFSGNIDVDGNKPARRWRPTWPGEE